MRKLLQQAHTSLKHILAAVLYYSGLLHLYKRKYFKEHAVVLMYHRVLPPEYIDNTFTHPAITVSEKTFAKHIAFLSKNFQILSDREFFEHFRNKTPFTRNSCMITFDDGWIDNYLFAFPVLKKYHTNATIFIPYNYIDSKNMFWPEELGFLLYQAYANRERLHATLKKSGLEWIASKDPNSAKEAINDFVHQLRNKPYKLIHDMISAVKNDLDDHPDIEQFNKYDSFSNWEQLHEMQNNGISFGSHTLTHRLLTQLDDDDASREITESKSMLSSKLGGEISTFAYPNGNKNDSIVDTVKQSDYKLAFSTTGGVVSCNDNPHTIRRMNMNDSGTKYLPMFYCRILGIM